MSETKIEADYEFLNGEREYFRDLKNNKVMLVPEDVDGFLERAFFLSVAACTLFDEKEKTAARLAEAEDEISRHGGNQEKLDTTSHEHAKLLGDHNSLKIQHERLQEAALRKDAKVQVLTDLLLRMLTESFQQAALANVVSIMQRGGSNNG